jgi:predicted alpha/beta superfamily hydrolase
MITQNYTIKKAIYQVVLGYSNGGVFMMLLSAQKLLVNLVVSMLLIILPLPAK